MLSNILVAGLGMASVVAGAPAGPSLPGHRKTGFSVAQVRNANFVRHGPSAMAKTLLKFGKPVPPELQTTVTEFRRMKREEMQRLARRANNTGSAVNTPESGDTEYLTPVQIGTPPQTLNLDFDTGSSDLWVFSTETSAASVSGQAQFDPTKSSTSKQLSGATFSISYGDGSSSAGNVFTDAVSVGGVTFDKMAVETAQKVSGSFTQDTNNDGLLGLAFSTLNTVKPTAQKTFFDNIRSTLDQPVFTADLRHNAAGTYNFGFIDTSVASGAVSFTNVDTSQGFWTFTADSFSIGNGTAASNGAASGSANAGQTGTGSSKGSGNAASQGQDQNQGQSGGLSLADLLGQLFGRGEIQEKKKGKASGAAASGSTITGIADTGTTLAMLPDAAVTQYYSQVQGAQLSQQAGGFVFPCDAALPNFSYTVGQSTITIPQELINFSPIDRAGTTCFGGIQSDSGIGFSIFGDVALKPALVVFENQGNTARLGFAPKNFN